MFRSLLSYIKLVRKKLVGFGSGRAAERSLNGLEWNIILWKAEKKKGVDQADCRISSGAPTVSQTTG